MEVEGSWKLGSAVVKGFYRVNYLRLNVASPCLEQAVRKTQAWWPGDLSGT